MLLEMRNEKNETLYFIMKRIGEYLESNGYTFPISFLEERDNKTNEIIYITDFFDEEWVDKIIEDIEYDYMNKGVKRLIYNIFFKNITENENLNLSKIVINKSNIYDIETLISKEKTFVERLKNNVLDFKLMLDIIFNIEFKINEYSQNRYINEFEYFIEIKNMKYIYFKIMFLFMTLTHIKIDFDIYKSKTGNDVFTYSVDIPKFIQIKELSWKRDIKRKVESEKHKIDALIEHISKLNTLFDKKWFLDVDNIYNTFYLADKKFFDVERKTYKYRSVKIYEQHLKESLEGTKFKYPLLHNSFIRKKNKKLNISEYTNRVFITNNKITIDFSETCSIDRMTFIEKRNVYKYVTYKYDSVSLSLDDLNDLEKNILNIENYKNKSHYFKTLLSVLFLFDNSCYFINNSMIEDPSKNNKFLVRLEELLEKILLQILLVFNKFMVITKSIIENEVFIKIGLVDVYKDINQNELLEFHKIVRLIVEDSYIHFIPSWNRDIKISNVKHFGYHSLFL